MTFQLDFAFSPVNNVAAELSVTMKMIVIIILMMTDSLSSVSDSIIREGCKKKRPVFIVFYYEGVRTPPPPPFIVTWDSEIFGPYFHVVVDAISPETDFTLETNRKRVKEKLLKRTKNT